MVEQSLPTSEVPGSNTAINKFYRLSTIFKKLNWKVEKKEKDAGKWPIEKIGAWIELDNKGQTLYAWDCDPIGRKVDLNLELYLCHEQCDQIRQNIWHFAEISEAWRKLSAFLIVRVNTTYSGQFSNAFGQFFFVVNGLNSTIWPSGHTGHKSFLYF